MNLGFNNVVVPAQYLRKAGLHMGATLTSVSYNATETYEYIDIELDLEGKKFRERTFIPTADKVFPKKKYKEGVIVGEETKQEAYERSINEIVTKLFHLGATYLPEDELKASVSASNWKELVEKFNKALNLSGKRDQKLNFLTVWKNNDTKRSSNLIVPEKTRWVEAYKEGEGAYIKLNSWQAENQLVEKYPYQGNATEAPAGDTVLSGTTADSDLPF